MTPIALPRRLALPLALAAACGGDGAGPGGPTLPDPTPAGAPAPPASAAAGWRRFAGTGPGIRDHAAMAYDPDRGRAVLFGGSPTPETTLGDTWEFDGTSWRRAR